MKLNNEFSDINFQTGKRKLMRFLSVIFLILFSNVSFSQKTNPAVNTGRNGFRASVVKVDITPRQLSESFRIRRQEVKWHS